MTGSLPCAVLAVLVEPVAVRLIFFYTAAGEVHWIYDVIGIAVVGTILAIMIVMSRNVPRARNAFVVLLVRFGTFSAGWLTDEDGPALVRHS